MIARERWAMVKQKQSTKTWRVAERIQYIIFFNKHFSSGNFRNLKSPFRIVFQAFLLPIMLAIPIGLIPMAVFAADSTVTPKISVGAGFDDNIFFSSQDKVDSSVLTVSPGIDLDYRTLLSSLKLTADLDFVNYLDESDLNRTNQYYRLSGDHRIKERWTTSGNLNFYRDTTLNTYLQETGRAFDRIERDFLEAGGRVRYDLTLLSGVIAEYRFQTAKYDSDRYSDWDQHRADLYYSQQLKNQVDTISVGPSFYHRSNDFNDVDSFALNVGWARDWSTITRSNASIGARYTNVKRDDGTEDDNWGVRANIDITALGLVSRTTFRYFHELRTTVEGDDVNVDNFHLIYRRSITERFGAGLEGRLVFSYKLLDRQTDINDERYYWLEPNLYYQLTRHFDLSLRYRYQNNVEFRDNGDITRERNLIWLQLSYALPIPM
jgi:hypothetical protein